MKLASPLLEAINESRARLRIGYPWWLRPWMGRNIIGITLGRTIYLSSSIVQRSEESIDRLLRHELAHVAQVNRLGLARFLWFYVTEFLLHLKRERSVEAAYRRISFEVEAAAAEEVL